MPGTKLIDWKMPLPWIVSACLGLIVTLGGVLFELRDATRGIIELKGAISEVKATNEKRADEMSRLAMSNSETRATLGHMQNEMTFLRGEVAELRREQRAMIERKDRK